MTQIVLLRGQYSKIQRA